jgi:SAM-dependent MidA family methyltransferase
MGEILGGEPFWIVEAGAGPGFLARDILDSLNERAPRFFETVRYGIVERGAPFVDEQRARLASYADRVEWLDVGDAGSTGFEGCFLANEFFDALPAHRVVIRDGALREIYVIEENGRFAEGLGEPSTDEIALYFDEMEIHPEEGQQAEVNLEVSKWYDRIGRALRRGFVLSIDYGHLAPDLYHPDRRSGTLACYYRHTRSDDPYARIGLQDMTTHVNFTDLIKRGEAVGLQLTGFVPQYRFLLSLGFLKEVSRQDEQGMSSSDSMMDRLTMKHLILPGGMGDTFKVLIQHKGVDPVQLTGLREL